MGSSDTTPRHPRTRSSNSTNSNPSQNRVTYREDSDSDGGESGDSMYTTSTPSKRPTSSNKGPTSERKRAKPFNPSPDDTRANSSRQNHTTRNHGRGNKHAKRRHAAAAQPPSTSVNHRTYEISEAQAPFTNGCLGTLVVDESKQRVYIWHGAHHDEVAPRLHVLDLVSRKWKDLVPLLRYRPSNTNFFADNGEPDRSFPSLSRAALCLALINERDFLFFFGGYDPDVDKTVATLYAISLSQNELPWTEISVQNGPVCSRMNASMVAIKTDALRLYIFGGRSSDSEDANIMNSFSIAEFRGGSHWAWIEKDVEYSQRIEGFIPSLGFDGHAVVICGGKQILLTQGREKEGQITFYRANGMVVFHVARRRFQLFIATGGSLLPNLSWYYAYPVRTKNATGGVIIAGVKLAGHLAEKDEDRDCVVPELWLYEPWPEDTMTCLDISKAVWDTELNLPNIAVCNNSAFLLGNNDSDGDNARFNRIVEFPLQRLLP